MGLHKAFTVLLHCVLFVAMMVTLKPKDSLSYYLWASSTGSVHGVVFGIPILDSIPSARNFSRVVSRQWKILCIAANYKGTRSRLKHIVGTSVVLSTIYTNTVAVQYT